MAVPDYLLDTSWSIQYISSGGPSPTLYNLFRTSNTNTSNSAKLHELSNQCRDYMLSQAPAYRDELNDEIEKTGILRECAIEHVKLHDSDRILGLSIETRYQKTTYRVILVPCSTLDNRKCPVNALLYKASQSHMKNIKSWLGEKFGVPLASPLAFPTPLVPKMCSEFLMELDEVWGTEESDNEALRQATLRQVVGSLRITITISNATGAGIAPQLKSMDFDVPTETLGLLLKKAQGREGGGGSEFLEELAAALHERTGLRLPLAGKLPAGMRGTSNGNTADREVEPEAEPPLKVTRIHCAAFAFRADGGFKLAGKPIEDAESIGYDGHVLRKNYMRILQSIVQEAERRREHEE